MAQEIENERDDAGRRPIANLGWALGMVLRCWQVEVDEVLRGMPSGSRGYHLLSAVVHNDPPTQGALSEQLAIDRTVLTYLIDDLVSAGLVERQLDLRDRRARRVVPTDRGRHVLVRAETRVAAVEGRVLEGLTEAERKVFRDTALRAATRIHEVAPSTNPCDAVESVLEGSGDTPSLTPNA